MRKAEALLAAHAKIAIIAPMLDHALEALINTHGITHLLKAFEPDDIDGFALVFAATSERYTNRCILQACQAANIPCCSVDGNWMHGDFVTPAVFRKDHLTVAISTGGQSCRRSRLIRNTLAQHLETIDAAEIFVLGTSHQQLSLAARDALQLQGSKRIEIGGMLQHVWGLHAFMLLSTCNRIELLGIKSPDINIQGLLIRILGLDMLPPESLYIKQGRDAFAHTAFLSAGLLSQMTGENHIVAQIKQALAEAVTHDWANGMLQEWIDAALHISKEIRRTVPGHPFRGEVEDAAATYLDHFLGTIEGKPVIVVIGTGAVGQGLVAKLAHNHCVCHWVYHEHIPAQVPAGVMLTNWEDWRELLPYADGIVTATSSPEPILTDADASRLQGRPRLLIDLATPRNISPSLAGMHITLLDLDDLKKGQLYDSQVMEAAMQNASHVVQAHHAMFDEIMRSFQTEP